MASFSGIRILGLGLGLLGIHAFRDEGFQGGFREIGFGLEFMG